MIYLLSRLTTVLERQRHRGRTPLGDPVGGLVIETGEAEGLVADLLQDWDSSKNDPHGIDIVADDGVAYRERLKRSPLEETARAFDLDNVEYDILLVALCVELDARVGRLVAYLNDNVAKPRPTLGLAAALATDGPPLPPAALLARPLLRDGLVELEGDGPLPSRTIRVADTIVQRLVGISEDRTDDSAMPPDLSLLDRLVLPNELREVCERWADIVRRGSGLPDIALVTGAVGSGKTSICRALAGRAGVPLVRIRFDPTRPDDSLRAIRREARWHRAAVLVRIETASVTWPDFWRALRSVSFPLLLEFATDELDACARHAPAEPLTITLEAPAPALRAAMWRSALSDSLRPSDDELDRLAAMFAFTPGAMAQAVRRAAKASELLRHPSAITFDALADSCRVVGSAGMGRLAARLPLPYRLDDLVLPESGRRELDLALDWTKHRRFVMDTWGFSERMPSGCGLTALFEGPPGTGKTMAAQCLASALGQDLFRVDLSQLMSKYIGETEKNLATLFDEAHASGAILFFDEADAIFGKRTEVKDAHDRYANVEIGYLLQRMEQHPGVTILATNRMGDMDEAFTRRFQFIIHFSLPTADERLAIWRGMFPERASVSPDLDLAALARDFQISGGEIRNAAVAAAFMAASEAAPIGMTHARRALRRELAKNGRVVDMKIFGDS